MKRKPVRINLSTKTEDVIATMREEMPHASYYFRKKYGGNQKYLKYEDALLDKALAEEKDQFTDIEYYISPVGNRWMTYTHVMYFPRAKHAEAFHWSFVYYETYGSCGAFLPSYSAKQIKDGMVKKNGKPDEVIVFTSHFFFQLSERTKVEYRSKELIKKFISEKCENAMSIGDDGEVIAKLDSGHGFGKVMSRNPLRAEVRTYLNDKELNKRQREIVKPVDEFYKLMKDGMFMKPVAIGTAINELDDPDKAYKEGLEKLEVLRKFHLEKEAMMLAAIHYGYVKMLERLLHIEITMKQSAVIAHIVGDNAKDAVMKFSKIEKPTVAEDIAFHEELIDIYAKTAKQMKLRSVTRSRIEDCMQSIMANYKRAEEAW